MNHVLQPAMKTRNQHHLQRDSGHAKLQPFRLQQSLSQANDFYNAPYARMYPSTLPVPVVPTNSAPGALQVFNNAEVQVQGIAPYGYGMPRYGPVSRNSLRI
jgi:hypothetical protein